MHVQVQSSGTWREKQRVAPPTHRRSSHHQSPTNPPGSDSNTGHLLDTHTHTHSSDYLISCLCHQTERSGLRQLPESSGSLRGSTHPAAGRRLDSSTSGWTPSGSAVGRSATSFPSEFRCGRVLHVVGVRKEG